MSYTFPPIVKLAERLFVEIEQAVQRFARFHRYSHGAVLREQSWNVVQLAHRAWRDRRRQAQWTDALAFSIDDLKVSLQLGQQIKAFASFEQFEALARLAADLGRQCGGWRKQQRSKGQDAGQGIALQRAQSLSSRAASRGEAHP